MCSGHRAGDHPQDVLAGGIIERIDPPAELRARLAQAAKTQAPFLYAEAGIWYDALATLSEQSDAAPADANMRQQRAELLEQVGLGEVTAFDQQRAK